MPVFTSSIEVTADYPTIKSSLNMNFTRSRALDPRVTFTRASVGTYVGRDGLIKTAGNDEPRFDHDPDTLESLGLLIEEPRTNQFQYSTDFSQGYWTKTRTSITSNTTTAPDGTTTASTLTVTTGSNFAYMPRSIGTTNGTTYSLSYWVKYNNCQYVWLLGGEVPDIFAYFDLINGVVGAANGYTCSITPYPNGWYRITAARTKTGATATEEIAIGITRSSSSPTDNQVGDAVYVWGAQFETGSFPTSYIPTSGLEATRSVDQAYILGDDVPLGSGVSEYSIYVRGRLLATNNYAGISRGLVGMGSSSSNRIRIPHNNAGSVEVYSGGSIQAQLFTSDIGTTERKIALAVKKNDFAMSMDGGTVQTDTSGDIPLSINTIGFGQSSYDAPPVTYPSTSYIKEFRIYPKRLTNAQLQLLTS